MTAIEAISVLNKFEECVTVKADGAYATDKYIHAKFSAIKALEKQIPKKPVMKNGETLVHLNKGDKPHEWKVNKWQEWCCPVCGWFVGERYNVHRNDGSVHSHDQRKSKYCNECGQAIDWTELLGERLIN